MENKNLGVLIAAPRKADYILGEVSQLTSNRIIKDWSIYLPAEESQRNKVTDFLDCVSMSMTHSLGTQLNYLLINNLLSDEALNFFHNNGYIENGVFNLSSRFNAKLNGTDITKGQYLNVAGDSLRIDGFIPFSKYPMTEDMTWDEFYATVPQNLIDLGKKALWFINIQYQWINQIDIPFALAFSPIQCASEVCAGWDSGQVVQKCSGQPLQHSTMIYGLDSALNYLNFDHYSPYKQLLASNYELPVNMEYLVTTKPTTLRNGMVGKNVLKLQQNLNKLGANLTLDSFYGPKTQKEVIAFQTKYGLAADGIAGQITLSKIKTL